MIPVRLSLRNFLSYGDDVEPLNFTSFQLACLSGRNGHGKSALLDAITWALWGEARKAGYSRNPDPDLLRQNAEDMAVEFTFLLDGREYQVFREYRLNRRSSKLEFRGRDPGEAEYYLLTGSSKKETQTRIIETLGLDYKTFTNSSFLQQGKADEFTRQPPRERKEILCTILGLDYYDRLLEEAKQRWSTTRAEKKATEARLENLDKQLAEEPAIRRQNEDLSQAFQKSEASLDTLRQEENRLREQITNLNLVRDRVQRWQDEKNQLQKQQSELQSRRQRLVKEQEEMQALLNRAEEIQKNYERYEAVDEQLRRLVGVESDYREKDTQRQALERRIERKRGELREQLAALESERKQIEQAIQDCEKWLNQQETLEANYKVFQQIESELKTLEAKRADYDRQIKAQEEAEKEIEHERQALAESIAELRGSVDRLQTLRQWRQNAEGMAERLKTLEEESQTLRQETNRLVERGQETNWRLEQVKTEIEEAEISLGELQEKITLLQKNDTSECPLCKQPLQHQGREEIIKHFEEEIQQTQKTLHEKKEELKTRKAQRDTLRQEYKSKSTEQEKKEQELTQARNKQEELKNAQQEIAKLETKEQQLKAAQNKLKEEQFAQSARTRRQECQLALQELGFDPEKEKHLQKSLQAHRRYEREWLQLQDAIKRKEQSDTRLKIIQDQTARLQSDLENERFAHDERESLSWLQRKLKPLEETLAKRKSLQDEHHALRNAPVDYNRLQQTKDKAPRLKQELQALAEQLQSNQKRQEAIQKSLDEAAPSLNTLERTNQQRAQKEKERRGKEIERDDLQIQLGGVREKLAQLTRRREERQETQTQLKQLQRDERLYDTLKAAFSRDGIPALIVEESLPELETYANQLLQRLTNGAFSVALESQRQKQSGGMSETLDIQISDEMGTRNYELFSGGEAFRTDLALRIALSQLLCHRAGRRLQLLVIDEGFGTQDSDGLNNIVEAIADIQDEFEKIIVVTHLEELKERFMVRIEVSKEPGAGSRFEVVHT